VQPTDSFGIGCAQVEVRALAIVAHQETFAAFEASMEMDHRNAPALIAGDHPVAGLQYETARDGIAALCISAVILARAIHRG